MPTSEHSGRDRDFGADPHARPQRHIGWIVAGSLAVGLLCAVLLVAAPFIPANEDAVTGAVLCGLALGWALLAVLSVRLTDQPQRWAAAPALLMGLGGLLLLEFGPAVRDVLDWAWPPVALALAIWSFGLTDDCTAAAGGWCSIRLSQRSRWPPWAAATRQ